MVGSLDYQLADDDVQREAFSSLRRYIQTLDHRKARELSVEEIVARAAETVARRQEREEMEKEDQ
jgi:hypothetical protein